MYCIIASISITVLCCILVLDCVRNYISDKLSKPYVFNMAANKRFIIFYIFCWFICLWDYLVYKTQTTKFDPVFYSAIFVIIIVILLNICFIFYGDLCRNIRTKRLKQLNEQLCTIKNAWKNWKPVSTLIVGHRPRPTIIPKFYLLTKRKEQEIHTLNNVLLDSYASEIESRKAVFFLFVSVLLIFMLNIYLFVSLGIIAVSATYIGFKVLGTILIFLTPICLKAIIKPIVNSLDFLPKDFVNFINQKFTFFGLRCTIFSKIWLKQRFIFLCLISLAWFVVFTLNTIYHMQFETLIFSYCFSFSVCYTGGYSIIIKNRNLGFIFCMFIYTFFIICFSKYVFFSVLSLCCIDIYDMYNKTETKPEGKTSGSDKVFCESNKDVVTIDPINKEKKENKILSLLGLDYKKPRTWDIPDWARGYAKSPVINIVYSSWVIVQERTSIRSDGVVQHITYRWHINSDGGLHLENKKKIFSLISTCMVEKFYYKKFTQHITMLNLDTIHKDYTNTFLIKKKIQTRTTFYKGLTTLNKMNNYIDNHRYSSLGVYKSCQTLDPWYKDTIRVDHVVADILNISCELIKELHPRIALLKLRPYSNVNGVPSVLDQTFNTYMRYTSHMSYLYSYYEDLYKDICSFTIPKFFFSNRDDHIQPSFADILRNVDNRHLTALFFQMRYYTSNDANFVPADLADVSYFFARKGIYSYNTSHGIHIRRNVLNINTCIQDVNIDWFDGHWDKDRLSKTLGFYCHDENNLTAEEEKYLSYYTPNNIMGISYDRLLYLLDKVRSLVAAGA